MRRVVELVATLTVMGAWTWMELPEHERRKIILDVNLAYRRQVSRLAAMIAKRAMTWELDGQTDAADTLYDAAFRLMSGPYRRAEDYFRRTLGAQQ